MLKRSAQIVFALAILGGAALGWALSGVWGLLDAAIHNAGRAPAAFASGGLGGVLSPFAVGFFIFCVLLCALVLVSSRFEIARAAYAAWSPPARNPSIFLLAKIMAWATGITLVIALGFCSVDALTSYCLTPSEISIRPHIFGRSHVYAWKQVRRVKTICWRGSRPVRFVYDMVLTMDDGYNLQLPQRELSLTASPEDVGYFNGVSASLSGLPFSFDASSIEPTCNRLGALAARP